nr:unnamed protein product [Callosobruchus analis]
MAKVEKLDETISSKLAIDTDEIQQKKKQRFAEKDTSKSTVQDTVVPKEYNGYYDASISSESVSKSDRIRVKDTTRKTYDMGLDIYKPLSYHGPRFAEKKPLFTTDLTSRTATVGCRIKMTCSVISDGTMDIQWLKNKEPIHDETKYYTDYSNNVATLEILNTTVSDSAEYSCLAKNEHGVSITSADLLVVKCFDPTPSPPVFTRPIREHYRISNDELTLECKIRSQPTPTIRWFKDGEELGTGLRHSHTYCADGICRLSIKSPEDGDSGRYTCRVESSSWSDQVSHDVRFTGKEEHVRQRSSKSYRAIASVRPYFSNVLTDTFVPTGGSMALQVEVKGGPGAEVAWFKESLMLPRASPKHRTFVERGVHTLLVPSVSEFEAGKYTCRASNAFGKVETSAYVHVVHPSTVREGKPPMFLHRPDKILNVAPGEDISVSFRVGGDPKPTGKS